MSERQSFKDKVIGDWQIVEPRGGGGQGDVYKVKYRTTPHSAPGALKLCRADSEKAFVRFRREAELLKTYCPEHPGIVQVRDTGEFEGRPFFVMELATTSMDSVLQPTSTGTRLLRESPAVLLALFRQACDAVAHLHRADVLHRDIKPSNVLLMLDLPEPMRAAIADLGVAASQAEQGALTATHETVGTPLYRAPESVIETAHTKASDVYSLGKTLQAILAGYPPQEMGPRSLPRHAGLSEELWQALDDVIRCACAHDPGARYADAEAFVHALPVIVLSVAGSTMRSMPLPAEVSLADRAVIVLYEMLARCPDDVDSTDSWSLGRASRLVEYDFSMGLRELRAAGFIQDVTTEDWEGNRSQRIRPNEAAFRWAHEHAEAMEAARPVAVASESNDDDIPF